MASAEYSKGVHSGRFSEIHFKPNSWEVLLQTHQDLLKQLQAPKDGPIVVLVASTRPEVSRFAHLSAVTLVDIRDDQGVLGVPLGGSLYVKKALAETAGKVADFCEKAAALDHPQMGFILLRQCCGTSRVVHLLRAMDTKDSSALAEAVDNSVMDSALRAPCSEVARTQLTLPLRFVGCGLTRASDIASLASFTV